MKKIWFGILLACCVVAVSGCGSKKSTTQENKVDIHEKKGQDMFPVMESDHPDEVTQESNEVLENEGDLVHELESRYELATMLPFAEGDDKICAIAYMGNTGAEQEANLTAFYQKYFPTIDSSSWELLPDVNCGGGECFLVIPRYKETYVYVNTIGKNLEGNYEVMLSEAVEKEAFLVYCSVQPEYVNTEIHMIYNDNPFVLVPRFSAVDGRVEPLQVALDLTMEEAYN